MEDETIKKRRTRQHIIHDMGMNCLEFFVLRAGFTLERNWYDYGFDAAIHTFDETGQAEGGQINVQIKSTDRIQFNPEKNRVVIDLSKSDLLLWLSTWVPVFLVLYDARAHMAYYVELQEHFKENRILLRNVNKYIRIFIPAKNVFEASTILHFRAKYNNEEFGS